MPRLQYRYVGGDIISALILKVRAEFFARTPMQEDGVVPNSLRVVTAEVFGGMSQEERFAVVRELYEDESALDVRESFKKFKGPITVADIITHLVCAVVCQVLGRDRSIRAEDECRVQTATKSFREKEQREKQ